MKYLFALAILLCAGAANASVCYVSEYSVIASDASGRAMQTPQEPSIAVQAITHTTTTASSAFNVATSFIGIVCDGASFFHVELVPVATTSKAYIPANVWRFFAIPKDQSYKIAFCDADCA